MATIDFAKYEKKNDFVMHYLKPMLMQLGHGITDVVYQADFDLEHGWASETVYVYYGENRKAAIVNGDSNYGILTDVLNQKAVI